ncbi:MAG: S41 family peptidase [Bryobacterales bacterium]|nr:S41 family peptidase [Bryobacterales bacterium]
MRHRYFIALFLMAMAALPLLAEASNSVSRKTREETFRAVWETVRDRYYDPTFGGLDWDAVGREMKPKAINAPSDEAFYQVLQEMVDRLGQSHFSVLPPFWVGTRHLSRRGAATAGLELAESNGQVLVWRMREPAAGSKGLRPGCALLEAGGTSLGALREQTLTQTKGKAEGDRLFREAVEALLAGPAGETVAVKYSCGSAAPEAANLPLRYSQRERSESLGFMPSMETEFETKRLPGAILSIRFNLFVMSLLPRIRAAIQQAATDGTRGIVFDIRGNPGGIGAMANGIAGYLVKDQANIGVMKMRGAELKFLAFPQDGAFSGPVAVVVDGNSASTSEILAAGLQEMGRAIVVGERTMGAALPSFIVDLPGGALLQFAAADFVTPKGFRIEGQGVTPDIPVSLTAETLLAGKDAPLEAARDALDRKAPPATAPDNGGFIVTGN